MNVSRLVASIGGYFYSTGKDVIAIHLYGGNIAELEVDGRAVAHRGDEQLPVVGRIRIAVAPGRPAPFSLKLRIPGWAQRRDRQRQRRGGRRRRGHDQRLPRHHARMADGRHRRARPADAGPSASTRNPKVRMDVGRVTLQPRAAGLLPRAGRQPGRPGRRSSRLPRERRGRGRGRGAISSTAS